MKKLLFLFLLLNSAVFSSKAQNNLCNDPCTLGPLQWKTINLCEITHQFTIPPSTVTEIINIPYVFVTIAYRIKTCPGNIKSMVIEDYVFVDNRDYWISQSSIDGWSPALGAADFPCDPPSPSVIDLAITNAIAELLILENIPTTSFYDVYFKGACNSRVVLSFPGGSYFVSAPNDSGKVDTMYLTTSSTVIQSIPCIEVCCKATYEWKVITLSNGETKSKWVAVGYVSPDCPPSALPDYNSYGNKIEAQIWDPITNSFIPVFGTVVSQEDCQLTCSRLAAPPPPSAQGNSITTDIEKVDIPLELIATPTLVANFIHFKTNKAITKVLVYDMKGELVIQVNSLENNELNTSNLRQGYYFVQVYFDQNSVKTVKILKQ